MIKSLKTLLGLSLLGFFGVWTGCSSDSAPVAPYSASKAQDTSPATTEAVFTDDNLLRAVREAVFPAGTPATTTLTRDDLSGLKVLKASDKGITNLSGLENATDLDTLVLNGNSITSLDSLARLTNLEYLNLRSNKITSLDSLARLTNLEYLNLRYNSITSLTPLADLTNLERLGLGYNRITDVSSLASLTKLTHLALGGDGNEGISNHNLSQAVTNMPDLVLLKVNAIGLTDVSFLEGLLKLEQLDLSANNGITDWRPVACLPKLKTLALRNSARSIGNAADGYNVHIQYLRDRNVEIMEQHGQGIGF